MPSIDNVRAGGVIGDPLKQPLDGFDPLIPYQMVPLDRSKEMVVRTDNFPVSLKLKDPNVASMTNFRIVQSTKPGASFPFPPPGTIVLPERSVVQFTLQARTIGMTLLEGRELPPNLPPLKPEINLAVSVHRRERREIAICYLFDRIHRDVGARRDFPSHFVEVNNIIESQTGFNIVNADGIDSGNRNARKIKLRGSMGRVFDLDNKKQIGRIVDAFDTKFPGVAASRHVVVYAVPVPIRQTKTDPAARILGVCVKWRREKTGQTFNTLFIGPQEQPRKADFGGPTPSVVQSLRNTIAHEIGHSLGLWHDPDDLDSTLASLILEFNPSFFFQPSFRNLMFPFAIGARTLESNRINANQIEIMHKLGPQFRERDF